MNQNVKHALETLKMETLLVLYRHYMSGGSTLGIKQVRELMKIPPTPFANNPNDMVYHLLCWLKADKFVTYENPNKWYISPDGIEFVEI